MSDRNDHEVRDLLVTGALLWGAAYMGRNHPNVLRAMFVFFGVVFSLLALVQGMWDVLPWSIGIPTVVIVSDHMWREGQAEKSMFPKCGEARYMECPSCKRVVFTSDVCFYCRHDFRYHS